MLLAAKSKLPHFIRACLSLVFLVGFLVPWPVAAASDNSQGAVTVGYGTDTPLQNGMIVKLKDNDASKVEPLTLDSIDSMHGVVVPASDATVTLSNSTPPTRQAYVATIGRYDVLVSTQNGPIHIGDYVTISSLAGIGMKADRNQPVVLGKAADNFDGTGNVEGQATLKDANGHKVSVALGRIPVDIGINHNPLAGTTNGVPGFLSGVAKLVTDKPVSPLRLYIGLFILVVAVVIAGSLLYGGVKNGMISIGRNPLAKKQITRNLFQVIMTSLGIFVIGVFAVYLLLRL